MDFLVSLGYELCESSKEGFSFEECSDIIVVHGEKKSERGDSNSLL